MKNLKRALLAAPLFLLAACASGDMATRAVDAPPAIGPWGVDLTSMDASVRPGDDFFRYVNGSWIKTAQIPADRTSWGSIAMVRDKAEKETRQAIIDSGAETHAKFTVGQQVADFDKAFQDIAAIEARGLKPVRADLDAIAAVDSYEELTRLMGKAGFPGGPIGFAIFPDFKNPNRYLIDVTQDGLGLPDRDYYLRKDKQFVETRAAYRDYAKKMLTLAGYPAPGKAADAILKLETDIAKQSWAIEKRRDLDATYNLMTREQLKAYAPGYPWEEMFAALALPAGFDRFNPNEASAIQSLAASFRKVPLSAWKAYMTFRYLNDAAPLLPKAFDDASFAFNGQTLSGQKEQRPRWKRSISAMSGVMGEALGELYVKKNFSPEAKAAMADLVENMRAAYKARIEALDWMGPETKARALQKLAAFNVKIGYPDSWKDYSTLDIRADDPVGNAKRLIDWEWNRQLARIDQPVDKNEWFMSPQTVNAYYNPPFNEIVFPAAFLQAPMFDAGADPAINYGAIASVIGHEMGHGFDDQGAKVDADGVQRNWWTPEDEARFRERTKALSAQYAKFEPLPGIFVNGELTLGENIGDLGGIEVALEAYRRSLDGKEPPVLDGFTGEQRFFLGYAQARKGIYRDQALRNLVLSDPHSPNQYRVNGVMPNVDDWYTTFNVGADAKMYLPPEQRVKIW